jgi:hypothetical protein
MPYRFRKLTAWLGVLAIWLAVVAPLVSQASMRDHALPDAVVCGEGHDGAASPMGGAHHALHLDACGYCAFFAHTPALGGATPAAIAAAPPVGGALASPADAAPREWAYRRAQARAPPETA